MRLHLVRHLAPSAPPGVCYGRSDLTVDERTLAAALPSLRACLPAHAPFMSSPLRRCASLATALATTLASDVAYDPRLVELDFGAWEMRAWDDIARAEIDAWANDVEHYRPGGGESVFDMALRIAAFHDELMRQPWPEVVIICHAGTMRLLAARQAGNPPAAMARIAGREPHAIGYGEVMVLGGV